MKINITNGGMEVAIEAINKFSSIATGKEAYAMFRNLRILQSEIQDYTKFKNELVVKYGKETEEGVYSIEPNTEEYNKFLEELLPVINTALEVDVYQLDNFELPECKTATVNDYLILEQIMAKKGNVND